MSLNMPAWAIALIFDVLILMIGTFIDVSPAILLLTPILLPVMVQYGFSPLQFGAMMITGLAIGLVTPPVGMCLNACNKINRACPSSRSSGCSALRDLQCDRPWSPSACGARLLPPCRSCWASIF